MSDPLVCEVEPVGGDGLIDPDLFVIRSVMLPSAASQIEAAGDWLSRMGDDLAAAMDDISAEWWKLPGCYEAPEASEVYLLLNPACEDADLVRATLGSAALLLEDYSAAVAAERGALRDLSARAEVFRREVLGTPWREDGGNIARNTALLEEHAAIAHRINAAAVECARGIYALVGTLPDGFVQPEVIPEWALASPDVPMPWGYPAEEDRNWLESLGHVFWRFGHEFGTSVAGLTGYDTLTDERTGAFARQSWAGLGDFLGSALVSTIGAPLVFVAAQADPSERDGFMEWLVERNRVFTGAMAGMASVDLNAYAGHATDDWEEDPVAAAGYTVLNVASLAAGFGVLSAGRAAMVAARVGAMSARTARIVALAGQIGELFIPATEIFTAGGIRVFAGLRNAIRLAELDGVTINPAAFVDDVARLADTAPGHTPVSEDLFEGGGSESGGMPDGELGSVVEADSVVGPDGDPPSGTPLDRDPGLGGGGGEAQSLEDGELADLPPREAVEYLLAHYFEGIHTFPDADDAIDFARAEWLDIEMELEPPHEQAINAYTQQLPGRFGATFEEINGALRTGPPYPNELVDQIHNIDEALAMRPLREPIVVDRAVEFSEDWRLKPADQTGEVLSEPGFMSTSLHGEGITNGADAILHLSVPEGTPALWVESYSAYGVTERELLLGRGLRWRMDHAILLDGTWEIFGEVVPGE